MYMQMYVYNYAVACKCICIRLHLCLCIWTCLCIGTCMHAYIRTYGLCVCVGLCWLQRLRCLSMPLLHGGTGFARYSYPISCGHELCKRQATDEVQEQAQESGLEHHRLPDERSRDRRPAGPVIIAFGSLYRFWGSSLEKTRSAMCSDPSSVVQPAKRVFGHAMRKPNRAVSHTVGSLHGDLSALVRRVSSVCRITSISMNHAN